MKHNVAKVAAICHCHLQHLRQITWHVGKELATPLMLAMVMSRLDGCSAALASLPQVTMNKIEVMWVKNIGKIVHLQLFFELSGVCRGMQIFRQCVPCGGIGV